MIFKTTLAATAALVGLLSHDAYSSPAASCADSL